MALVHPGLAPLFHPFTHAATLGYHLLPNLLLLVLELNLERVVELKPLLSTEVGFP